MNSIPADDTIARIISTIEPEHFNEYSVNWMSSVHTLTDGQVVSVDGSQTGITQRRIDIWYDGLTLVLQTTIQVAKFTQPLQLSHETEWHTIRVNYPLLSALL